MSVDYVARARERLMPFDPILRREPEPVAMEAAKPARPPTTAPMTAGQRDLLAKLYAARGGHVPGSPRVATMLQGLRLRLGDHCIETTRGVGYRLNSYGMALARELLA